MAFKTYPYARNEVPDDDYRRNPNDATKDRVKGILREHGLVSSMAFVNQIYDDIKAGAGNFLDVAAILKSAYEHNVPRDESLWDGVFEGFEERDTLANRALLLLETLPPINAANLSKTLHRILRAGDPGQQLVVTQQEYARQQDQAERESMIRELTAAGSFLVIRPSGEKVRYDTDGRPIEHSANGMTPVGGRGRPSDPGFAGMETDDLRSFYNTVMNQRRMQSMTKEELKAEINPARRQILEASSVSLRPPSTTGVELVNPDNGQVISDKRSLIRYINAGDRNTERLLKTGPNNSTDKAKAREFERILNS
jgi:hypothetical protein